MKELAKTYSPKELEEKWYPHWEKSGFFKPIPKDPKKRFCIVIPPPNVTGVLHMGHALVDTIQDILIRYKRMSGYETLWVPGTDHAGIATQTIVEKHLIATLKKRRKDFDREEFLAHVWKWKEEKESGILSQLKKLGCSCDWSRLRFTMDEKSNKAVRTVFKKMYDEKLIYRGDYLVNWDPVTQTALADDEVEYEERDSYLWFFKYPIKGKNKFITIATTRPETMLGDTAVAINPKDDRYLSVMGEEILLPIMNRTIPIIEDQFVDPKFGTGAVKITPAHDFNDYDTAMRHNIELINIMTPDGHINENGKEFCGLSMQKAREAVVEKMKALGLLEKIEPYKLRVGVSYRSKATIQPYLSEQWFVKMTAFKNQLINAVKTGKVQLIPKHWEKTYFHWIENIRDWCISRQLWWGHRIPIWYHKEDKDVMICYDKEGLPPEVQKEPDKYYQDEDVLDTWFSSALWPFSTLGWPDKTEDLQKFYPTSVLVTAHDILFFWVARMILMGVYVMKDVPFHKTFIHGLIYGKSYWKEDSDGSVTYLSFDEKVKYDLGEKVPKEVFSKWEKMSKSKGNIINPLEIIDEYGTDAMRIALCSSATNSRQIDLDRRRFDEYKNFANKIWNSTRFIVQNLEENKEKNLSALTEAEIEKGLDLDLLNLEDKWILSRLNQTIKESIRYLDEFSFDKYAKEPYSFFWDDFCAYYLELTKPYLFGKIGNSQIRANKQKMLVMVLMASIRLMHPVAPFITEEIFSILKESFPNLKNITKADPYTLDLINSLLSDSCIVAPFPKGYFEKDQDQTIESSFNFIKELIYAIRNIRAEMQLPLGMTTDLYILSKEKDDHFHLTNKNQNLISTLVKVGKILFISEEEKLPKQGSSAIVKSLKLHIPLPQELLENEKKRLLKEEEKLVKTLAQTKDKLENKEFLSKAPSNVVAMMQQTFDETEKKLLDISNKLKSY